MTGARSLTGATLWLLAVGPAAWLLHFLFIYGGSAMACARPNFGIDALAVPGTIATLAALGAVAAIALRGHRARCYRAAPDTIGTPERRQRFFGSLLLGIAAVSGSGIVVTAFLPFVIGGCP